MIGLTIQLFLLFLLVGYTTTAQDRGQLEQQRNKIIEEIEKTADLLSTTAKQKESTLEDYQLLNKQITKRKSLIQNMSQSIDMENKIIAQNKAYIDSLQNHIASSKDQYSDLVRTIYIKKNTGVPWTKWLTFSGINEAFRNWRYTKQFESYILKKKDEVAAVSTEIQNKNEEIADNIKLRASILSDEKKQAKQLSKEQALKDKMLSQLKSEEQKLKQALAKKKKEREQLNQAIEDAIIAALKKNKEVDKTSKAASGVIQENKGNLAWPCKGVITATFGVQAHPTLKNVMIANNGIDISSSKPNPIQVVADGNVVAVSKVAGYDYMIIVQHGEYYTVYSRVSEAVVKGGMAVKQGDQIGLIDIPEDGRYTLHFELWQDKLKLNPQTWLRP